MLNDNDNDKAWHKFSRQHDESNMWAITGAGIYQLSHHFEKCDQLTHWSVITGNTCRKKTETRFN